MAENRNLHVNLSVKADTSYAKKQFEDLASTLNKLSNVSSVSFGKALSKDILQASDAALTLKQNLQEATNVNTGKLDLSVFQKKMQQSGQSLESYRQQLSKLGPEGEQAFVKLAQSVANAEIPLRKTNTLLTEFAGTLKNTARWQISSSILHGFMGAIQSAYGYAQDLNRSLNDIQIVTQHNSEYMAQFAVEANKAAKELSTTTTQYTNASLIFYQQGLSDAEVKKRTDVVIKMANASRQSAEEVSSQMTAVWNNFADGSKSLEYYADVMTALGAATASSSSEIAAGLQKFAAIGETVGLSYEYAASALATITATTRESADTVGNALKTLFARIQGLKLGDTLEDGVDLNKYSGALSSVGVQILDANNQLKDMDIILDELGERWQELSREQQTALAQTVAGQRQYAQFMTLMNNWDFMKQNIQTANEATGTLQKQADTYAQSWEAAQKRVKAAAQTIYQDLLDDKFFIGITNTFEKILTGIDGFIKSIGGLKGVIGVTGTLFLSVFEKQIVESISNASYSIKMFSQSGKEALQSLKNEASNQIELIAANYDSEGLNNIADSYKRIADLQQAYTNEYSKMSEAEKEHGQQLLDRQYRLEEIVKKTGEEVDLIRKEGMELAATAIIESKRAGQYDKIEYNEDWNRLENDVQNYNNALDQLSVAYQKVNNDSKLTFEEASNLKTALESMGVTVSDVDFDKLQNGGIEAREVLQNLRQELSGNFAQALQVFQLNTGVSSETIQKLVDNLLKEQDALKKEEDAVRSSENAHKEASESLKEHAANLEKNIQGFVKFAGGITSTISGLNSLKRGVETLTDSSKSMGEKILSATSSFAMGFSMMASGIAKLVTNWGPAVQFISGLPGLIGGVLTSIGAKIAAFWVSIGPVGWAIAGITAAVVGLTVAYKAFHKEEETALEKLQKSYEKTSAAAKQAQNDADELAEKYNNINDAISQYENAVQAFESCTTGTQEWQDALNDVNTALNNILQQAPELAQFIDSTGNIDLEAAKAYMAEVQNKQMMTMFAGNIGTTVANQQSLEIDREKLATDIAYSFGEGFDIFKGDLPKDAFKFYIGADEEGYRATSAFGYNTTNGGIAWDLGGAGGNYTNTLTLSQESVDKIEEDIRSGALQTSADIHKALYDVIKEQLFSDFEGDSLTLYEGIEDSTWDDLKQTTVSLDDFINDIINTEFPELIGQAASDIDKVDKELEGAENAVKGMAIGAVNYKIAQEKSLGNFKDLDEVSENFKQLGDTSEEVLTAFIANKLPTQIENLANKLAEQEDGYDKLWRDYQAIKGTNYQAKVKDGKFKYSTGDEDFELDISSVAWEVATIQTLTDNWGTTLEETIQELDNLLTKSGPEFVQWLANTKAGFSEMSKTDVNKLFQMFDGFNGKNSAGNGATSKKEIENWLTSGTQYYYDDFGKMHSKEGGLGLTDEMAQAYGFDSIDDMAQAIKDAFDAYQEGLQEIYDDIPSNIQNEFKNLVETSDFNLDELGNIKDALIKAVAEGGLEAGDALLEIFQNEDIKVGELAEHINGINWNETSIDSFVNEMVNLGIITPEAADELGEFLEYIEQVADVDIGQATQTYSDLAKIISEVEKDGNIKAEDYGKLTGEMQDFFTLTADGTYQLTGDAEEFYKIVNEEGLQGFKNNIDKLKEEHETSEKITSRGSDFYTEGQFANKNDKGTWIWDRAGFLDSIEVLKAAGVDTTKWMAELNSEDELSVETIKEVQKALKECGEQGYEALNIDLEENEQAQEQNRIALLSAAKTYEDFKQLIEDGYATKADQDLWEAIGFDPSSLDNAQDLLDQIENGSLKTSKAIKAGWDEVKGSTESLSQEGFKTLLDSFDKTEDKISFTEEALKKVTWTAKDLSYLSDLKENNILSPELWEEITGKIDNTGLTLSEINEKYKEFLPTSVYEKWAAAAEKATLETIENAKDLEKEFENGNITAESYSSKIQELFKNGDVNLEKALQSVYKELENGKIKGSDANEIINALLNNSTVTTEQRIDALNEKIAKGRGTAEDYKNLIKEILGSNELTSQEKLEELSRTKQTYIGGGQYVESNAYSAKDRYSGYSQLTKDDTLSIEDRRKALEGMQEAMDQLGYSAMRAREYAAAVVDISKDAGDTAEETASKLISAFIGEDGTINESNYIVLGDMIEDLLGDMEGDAYEKKDILEKIFSDLGLNIENIYKDLQIAEDKFGENEFAGKTLEELEEIKNNWDEQRDGIFPEEEYQKAQEALIKEKESLEEITDLVKNENIDLDVKAEKVEEFLNKKEYGTEEGIQLINDALTAGVIDGEKAAELLDKVLDNTCEGSEEKLAALLLYLSQVEDSGEAASKAVEAILENDKLLASQKFDQIQAGYTDTNGQHQDYSDTDKLKAYIELLKESSLSEAEAKEIREAAVESFVNLKAATDETGLSEAELKQQAEELIAAWEKAGDKADELIPKFLEFLSGENGTIDPALWGSAIDYMIEHFDGLGDDAEQNFEKIKEWCAQFNIDLEAAGYTAENFYEKTKQAFSFEVDDFSSFSENMENLNKAFAAEGIDSIDKYCESVSKLIKSSTELGLTTDQARIAALNFTAQTLAANGVLDKNLDLFMDEIETVNDLYEVLDILDAAELNQEKRQRFLEQGLVKLGSKYKECSKEVGAFQKALASGTNEEKRAAAQELELAVNCAKSAEAYGYKYDELKVLADSYQDALANEVQQLNFLTEEEKAMYDTAEMASLMAERYIRVNESIANMQKNYEEYDALLDSMNAKYAELGGNLDAFTAQELMQADGFKDLQESIAGALNMTDAYNISAEFMAENSELIKGVIDGDVDSLNALADAFAQDFILHLDVDNQDFLDTVGLTREEAIAQLQSIPPGIIDLDNTPAIQGLVTLMEQAGYSAEEIKNAFAGMNIELEFADDVIEAENQLNELANAAENAEQAIEDSARVHGQNKMNMRTEVAKADVQTSKEEAEGELANAVETEVQNYEDTKTETQEGLGWMGTPKQVESTGYLPTFQTTTFPLLGGFISLPVPGEPMKVTASYPGIEMQPDKKTGTATKETKAKGLQVKSANKVAGGISAKNISGGNKPTSSSSGGGSRPSRGSSGSTPRPTTVSAPNITPVTPQVFDQERHDRMTHTDNEYEEQHHDRIDPESLYESVDNYLKTTPQKTIAKIVEDKDEVYTQRKKFRHERYEKDLKVDEKEYETKDSSMFKRLSEEIDQYHDINKVLENIGNKLDEINQRKSRAFGKAHIDAINEEKAALEEQLAAQNEYISQMATNRKELQEQMKATGWQFDENGDVSNYVQKKTQDVLDYNQAMNKWVDDTNENRKVWNDQAHEIADEYNATNMAITDQYNDTMDEVTEEYNAGAEILDAQTNAANRETTAWLNAQNAELARAKNESVANAYGTYNETVTAGVQARNAEIDANVARREEDLTANEERDEARWWEIENSRRQQHTANENQNDTTLTGLEQGVYAARVRTEDERVRRNYDEQRSMSSDISGYLGTYYDSDAASAAKDYVSQRNQDMQNAIKIIDNNAKNEQQLITNAYNNARADEQERAKNEQTRIENDAKNAWAKLENETKAERDRVENQYKTDETISKNKLSATVKAADNILTTSVNEASEIYTEGSQMVQHTANVAFKEISSNYKRGADELQSVYDDEAWAADQRKQDQKEGLQDWYDTQTELNDKQLESSQALTDLAKEQAGFVYDESEKMLGNYEDLGTTMADAMKEAQEIRNKLYDNAMEVIDYTLNLKVEISEQVMIALRAYLDALGTSADKATDRIANLSMQMAQFKNQVSYTRQSIVDLINSTGDIDQDILTRFLQGTSTLDDFDKIFNIDEFTADKVEKLKAYRDNLVSLINEQRALKEQMFNNVNTAFAEYQDKLNLQIEKITSLTKVTETYKAIVGIVGKKVLDASGELSETLAKSAFETQRDQTHTYKSILDEIDSNIADMKQKQNQFAIGSEMYQDFQNQIEQMEATRRSAQDNWLSSWQAEMQAATDYYAEAIDTITMHLDQSMSGLIGSLELLSNEYDRQKKISEIYVEDYEKIYQLNKLNRDVQNALDDSDHIKNKQQLKKLQQEINAANEDGVKMSQYDLDVLRKKFELELAREELEESRNAKSQVRMMRDAEGNYGYVYTADANDVAKAEQNYEDKLHELQVLNTNYIKQLEDNYLQLSQNVRDEIASLDISQFSSEEEYLAEVDRIQQAALELQERYGQQMDNATSNNRSLYENEWRAYSEMTGYKISADEDYLDKFEETTYSVLTGFQTMQEAKDQFSTSLAEAIAGAILAFEDTRKMQETAMEDGGTSMKEFNQDAINETEKITEQTEELATQAETMSESYQNAFEQIAESASKFATNYVTAIQPVIDSNLQLLDSIAKLIEHQANLEGTSGNGSGSGGITSGTRSAGLTWDAFATAGGGMEVNSKIGEYLPFIGALLQYGSYESNYEGWGTGETRRDNLIRVFGAGADQDINNWLSEHAAGDSGSYWLTIANNASAYGLEAMKKIMGVSFDTGGYTGDWNSIEGKLALLHEKELVLNKEDTDNILQAVDMVRKITQMIDLNALSAGSFMSDILSAATINSSNNETLQQEVHITAEFPNATDREEIIAAFDNLTNLAMQYAGKQNY